MPLIPSVVSICGYARTYVAMYITIFYYVVRLVDGPTEYEGRVEVYHNGEWGTVCDSQWDLNDAQVVCNELGVGRAIAAKHDAFYGQGSGRIWLDSVYCTGSELAIRNCRYRDYGYDYCKHDKDASVQCTSGILSAY